MLCTCVIVIPVKLNGQRLAIIVPVNSIVNVVIIQFSERWNCILCSKALRSFLSNCFKRKFSPFSAKLACCYLHALILNLQHSVLIGVWGFSTTNSYGASDSRLRHLYWNHSFETGRRLTATWQIIRSLNII